MSNQIIDKSYQPSEEDDYELSEHKIDIQKDKDENEDKLD